MYENGEVDCIVIQHSQQFFCPWNETINEIQLLFSTAPISGRPPSPEIPRQILF